MMNEQELTPQEILDELQTMYDRLEVLKGRLDWLAFNQDIADDPGMVKVAWKARAAEAVENARVTIGRAHTVAMVAHDLIPAAREAEEEGEAVR